MVFIYYSLLLCALLYTTSGSKQRSSIIHSRIHGGEYAEENDKLPYIVHLTMDYFLPEKRTTVCGGSLITTRIVLTAAHCMYFSKKIDEIFVEYFPVKPEHIEVLGGTTFLSKGYIRRGVRKISIPEVYRTISHYMDIAGLILDQPMQGENIATINLCKYDIPDNKLFMIAGWGQMTEADWRGSDILKFGKQQKLSDQNCGILAGYSSSSMFCAKHPFYDEGPCWGDSGGPAVYKGEVCGIVSFGKNCDKKNSPDVFTKITAAKYFIDDLLKVDVNMLG